MDAIERVVDQEQTRRMVGAYTFTWFVPRKPRVSVRVHDAASGERVIGVRYRVMSQPHMRPAPARRVSFGGSQVIDDQDPQVRLCTTCHRTSTSPLQNAPRLCYTDKAGGAGSTARTTRKHTNNPKHARRESDSHLESDGLGAKSQQAPAHSTPPQPDRNPPNTHPHTPTPHAHTRPGTTP